MTKMENESSSASFTKEEILSEDTRSIPSSSSDFPDRPPPYEASVPTKRHVETVSGQVLTAAEEDKILTLLREIVRRCTLANPIKRPTAREVLKMIEDTIPANLLPEKFTISDDEDEEEEEESSTVKKRK